MCRITSLVSIVFWLSALCPSSLPAQQTHPPRGKMDEPLRPQYHFTPPTNWNNDPNGLIYYQGEYHLFYQYYPDSMRWGPMHWGHAVSSDMLHWKDLPIALYPDSLGYIYSGSAVVDQDNTSGFGTKQHQAMVAIFTYHDPRTNIESQAVAYSTDKGRTWTKYKDNPVIANPGLRDFRDPKVRWYAPLKKWIMVVSCHDHVSFYSSADLKHWMRESNFGKDAGAHAGVWECPDLFPLKADRNGETRWVLTVNCGGGPSGTRGTQYFIGSFDGHTFTAGDRKTRWLEAGPDEYAGVTWGNTPGRTVFLGWLDNWPAARADKPAYRWRGGMTMPVELQVRETASGDEFLTKEPVTEITKLETPVFSRKALPLKEGTWAKTFSRNELSSSRISLSEDAPGFSVVTLSLGNDAGEHLDITYDEIRHRLTIDRTQADEKDFQAASPRMHTVGLADDVKGCHLTVYYDRSVVEVFAGNGRYLTTDLVFPQQPYDRLQVSERSDHGNSGPLRLGVSAIRSVWR